MRRGSTTRRNAFLSVLAALAVLGSSPAARAGDKEACVKAFDTGQLSRQRGRLKQASTDLLECARPVCPDMLRADCTALLQQIEAALPKLVVVAKDDTDKDLVDVRLSVDGTLVAPRLDGRAMSLDPGEHVVRLEANGFKPYEERVLLAEQEGTRRVVGTLARVSGPAPSPTVVAHPAEDTTHAARSPVPVATWILGGVGVLGFAGFGFFGASGSSDASACAQCTQRDVDDVKTKYLVADISLAVGLAAVAGAIYFLVTAPSPAPSSAVARW